MSVELDRIDLAMLYCICHYRADELDRLTAQGYTRSEAEGMIHTLGITRLWGHVNPTEGLLNRFIARHKLGKPLFHSTQFYRIADNLAAAGWLVGRSEGEYYFTPREAGKIFVANELDATPPADWPVALEVEAGQVVSRLILR